MSRVPILVALSTLALLAGCVAPAAQETSPASAEGPVTEQPEWVLRAVPGGEKHDHSDPMQHQGLSTPNFEVLGWDPLVTDHYGTTLTGMGCGGVGDTEDGRRIAIVHSISTDVAFVVADITDPANPQKLGEYFLPNVVVWDATVTPDGQHVLVGAYPFIFGDGLKTPAGEARAGLPETFAVQPMFRDACTGETRAAGPEQYFPFGPGLVMVGIQDPMSPKLEQWVPQPVVGPHSVYSVEIDGTTWVASSVTNLQHEASYYDFFHVVNNVLVPVAHIEAPGSDMAPISNGHIDVTLQKHPVTGQLLAYLANWGQGVSIYDFSIPQLPVPVATWMDGDAGNLHNTLPLPELWGDKHYTIVGQEVGHPDDRPSGWIYVLDTTDPANPVEVSRWTIPVEPDWADGGLQFSTHYVEVLNRTMFVTNYHGGMWAVDLSDVANPRTAGIFVPDRVSPAPFDEGSYGPGVEDVVVDFATGILTVWDNAGGIYQLRYHEGQPAPRVLEWASIGKE